MKLTSKIAQLVMGELRLKPKSFTPVQNFFTSMLFWISPASVLRYVKRSI